MFDCLIVNGRVINGSGGPWIRADVGIKDGRISRMGNLSDCEAEEVIDADDRVVCPGFIDAHSHSDFNLLVNPQAESKIHQGITTEVIGQCGTSAAPVDEERLEMVKQQWAEGFDLEDVSWSTMQQYLSLLTERGIALNCAPLVGHGNLRRLAMGEDDREPTEKEISKMKQLLSEALQAGAFGMSSGLIYPPGMYSDTQELIALAEVLAEEDALYFSHIRNEGDRLLQSLREAIDIGRSAGCRVQISHLKAVGEDNWGMAAQVIDLLNDARSRGLEITADQYPYTASATGLTASLPGWAHDGGREALLQRLADEDTCQRMKQDMEPDGWDRALISRVRSDENKKYEGQTVAEVAQDRGIEDPREAVIQLLQEEEANVGVVKFGMSEDDVCQIMQSSLVMVGTDGSALSPQGPLGKGKPHPRSYGTFPRVLGRYVREQQVLRLSAAVAKMTSLPAATLGLWDRGLLSPGFWADVVVFDPNEVHDQATFTEPHQFPRGIDYVMVNGEIVIDPDRQRDALPGQVLRRTSR